MTRRPKPGAGQAQLAELVPTLDMSEKAYQKLIVVTAERNGWVVNHSRPSMVRQNGRMRWITNDSYKGWFDLVLIHPKGWFLYLEVKDMKYQPSPEQVTLMQLTQAACEAADTPRIRAFIVRPDEWPRVEKLLTRPLRATPVSVAPETEPTPESEPPK